jgi:hypothetical protein
MFFCKIDNDGSGEISLNEFYATFKLARSPFSDRVFSLMGTNTSIFLIIGSWVLKMRMGVVKLTFENLFSALGIIVLSP